MVAKILPQEKVVSGSTWTARRLTGVACSGSECSGYALTVAQDGVSHCPLSVLSDQLADQSRDVPPTRMKDL